MTKSLIIARVLFRNLMLPVLQVMKKAKSFVTQCVINTQNQTLPIYMI